MNLIQETVIWVGQSTFLAIEMWFKTQNQLPGALWTLSWGSFKKEWAAQMPSDDLTPHQTPQNLG